LLLTLACVAGAVDAGSYQRLHVFTANMTGNTVLAGLALGSGEPWRARDPLTALLAFAVGVAFVRVLRRVRAAFALEAAALFTTAALLAHPPAALIAGAFALGLQTGVTMQIAPGSSTTYMSGTFSKFAAGFGGGADGWFAGAIWLTYLLTAVAVGAVLHVLPAAAPAVPIAAGIVVTAAALLGRAVPEQR
jgi:uncharacterized membrane protein YoaK (UPF0700 family)